MNHQWGFLVLTVIAGCVLAYDDVIAEQTADDDAELLVEEDDTIEVRIDVAIVCVVVLIFVVVVVIVTVGAMQAAERSELQSVLTTVVNVSVLDPSFIT